MALHKITQNGKLAECRFSLASEVKIVLILSGNLVYPLDMQALIVKRKKELFKRKNAEIVVKSAFLHPELESNQRPTA